MTHEDTTGSKIKYRKGKHLSQQLYVLYNSHSWKYQELLRNTEIASACKSQYKENLNNQRWTEIKEKIKTNSANTITTKMCVAEAWIITERAYFSVPIP